MNKLPSSEFRKTFGHLIQPTEVTVNGHTIGYWRPGIIDHSMRETAVEVMAERFNSRPFTPAPKK